MTCTGHHTVPCKNNSFYLHRHVRSTLASGQVATFDPSEFRKEIREEGYPRTKSSSEHRVGKEGSNRRPPTPKSLRSQCARPFLAVPSLAGCSWETCGQGREFPAVFDLLWSALLTVASTYGDSARSYIFSQLWTIPFIGSKPPLTAESQALSAPFTSRRCSLPGTRGQFFSREVLMSQTRFSTYQGHSCAFLYHHGHSFPC